MATCFENTEEQQERHRLEFEKKYKVICGDAQTLSQLVGELINNQNLHERYFLYGSPYFDSKNGLHCQVVTRNCKNEQS
jgi:hypothetical protein